MAVPSQRRPRCVICGGLLVPQFPSTRHTLTGRYAHDACAQWLHESPEARHPVEGDASARVALRLEAEQHLTRSRHGGN